MWFRPFRLDALGPCDIRFGLNSTNRNQVAKIKKQSIGEQLVEAFALEAASKGCPRDQVENFVRAGVFLQPNQLEFAAYARLADSKDGPKDIMMGGGRGAAKTHGILAQIFCDDCQRMPDLKVLVLRKVGRSNKEQIQDFRKKLLLRLPHKYREQASTITFDNGSLVILGNFKDERDIDKYLGLEYDLIHIVESNQLTLTKKMNILSCLRTNKSNWRPRCYEDTNPGGIGHFHNKQIFVELWRAKKETETRYIHCTVDDNKFVDPEYKSILEKYTGWQREAWLNGSWDFMAGAFFTNFNERTHVYPANGMQFNIKHATRWFGGYDYGFAHNTTFLLAAEDSEGNTFIHDEYMECGRTIEDNSEGIRYLLRNHGLTPSDLDFIAAGRDCFNRNEEGKTIAMTYQEHGIDMMPADVDRINGWARCLDGFGDIQRGLKPRIFISQNCPNLIQQIQMAQHSEKRVGDIEKFNANEDGEGGDDCLDNFRFIISSDSSKALKFAVPIGITKFGISKLLSI